MEREREREKDTTLQEKKKSVFGKISGIEPGEVVINIILLPRCFEY